MRQSYDIRATVANMSYSPIRCDRNVIMLAMSYFCRQNVSQISLELVVNCSHPSEILALHEISLFIISVNGDGPGESAHMRRLARASAARIHSVMEGYRAHNSNTHCALYLIPFTCYGCLLCFTTKCLSVVCLQNDRGNNSIWVFCTPNSLS